MTIWESLQQSHAFVKDRQYAKFVEAVDGITDSPPQITHTECTDGLNALEKIFASPCVELVPLRLKRDKVAAHYVNFEQASKLVGAAPGNVAQFQNNQVEDP